MPVRWKDLYPLRVSALTLLVAVALSWLLVDFVETKLRAAQQSQEAAARTLDNARLQYQRSGEEKQNILRYLPAYEQLTREGFIGAERRIAWLEALHSADRRVGLFGVQYQIEARQRFDGAQLDLPPLGGRLHSSIMRLDFGVTHEGDLLRFLEALQTQQAGLYSIQRCRLEPAMRGAVPEPRKPNLKAHCELRWLTIDSGQSEAS